MSAIAFLIAAVIALVAMLIRAGIRGEWAARMLAADFFFALALLLLPTVVHA